MRAPDRDHWSQDVFREVVEPERIVMTGCWADAERNPTRPETVVTVTFEELGGNSEYLTTLPKQP